MAKRKVSSSKNYILITTGFIIFFIAIAIGSMFIPKKVDINLVDLNGLEYGQNILKGRLYKDTSVEKEGNFFLIINDGKQVLLDIQGVESFLNQKVEAEGILTPGSTPDLPLNMTVTSIKLENK